MYKSIGAMKKANRALGRHWFDPRSVEFFDSRIESKVIRGRYFISSSQIHDYGVDPEYHGPRTLKVHRVSDDGAVDTLWQYPTPKNLDEARQIIEMAAINRGD